MSARIIALGSVNVDHQVRVSHWPGPGETLEGSDFIRIGGGKAFNRAWLAKRLGVSSELVGRIGDDDVEEIVIAPLRELGVNIDRTRRVAGHPTGVSMIFTRGDGEKSIVLAPNANEEWIDADLADAVRAVSEAPPSTFLTCDLEVPKRVVRAAMGAARERGLPVLLDPSPTDRVDDELLRCATYVTPNDGEASRLVRRDVKTWQDAEAAGRTLCERGVKTALVKLGGRGCVVVSDGEVRRVEGFDMKAVDTTGAGDAFAGALAVALLEETPIAEAARFAMAAAAHAVTGWGSHTSYPSRADIEHLLTTRGR